MKRAHILSASAGSGKTYQLAYKYVRDVIEQPELYRAILAVTFTNKATEEMKSRILREIHLLASNQKSNYTTRLMEELELSEGQIRERALHARTLILHDYSRFSILTIDRFFQRIIRAFIKELGIDLNYNIELQPNNMLMHGTENLIESIAQNEELRKWMLEFAEERMNDGTKWDMRSDLISLGHELFKEKARERLSTRESKEELLGIVNQYIASSEQYKTKLQDIGKQGVAIMDRHGVLATHFKGQSTSFARIFERYAAGEVKEPSKTARNAAEDVELWLAKGANGLLRCAAEELRPLLAKLCTTYDKAIRVFNTTSLLRENYRSFALLADLYEQIAKMCDEENIMILGETKHILATFINDSNTPFIYEKVGNRYERFMIDEFQDTSSKEWKNMLPLLHNAMASSDKVSVFIVGDVKQSIYRWRGGDWRLLQQQAERDLGSESTLKLHLKENYRSLPNIVRFNNSIIEHIIRQDNSYLNEQLDTALKSKNIDKTTHALHYNIVATAYAEHEQLPARTSTEGGYAEVTLFDNTSIDSPFIDAIESAIERGYRYSDILILVRGATDAHKVANALFEYKEARFTSQGKSGFNVLTADALTIGACSIVEFIIAVFRLAVRSNNDIERGVYNRYLLKPLHSTLDDKEIETLHRIAHLSLMEAFEEIVRHYKLDERTEDIAALQAMHEQIVSFSSQRVADIQQCLKWWDEKGKDESLCIDMSDDTIEITTIHKAKGLERPIIIIPYCKWDTTPSGNIQQVVWAKADASDAESKGLNGDFPVIYRKTMRESAFTNDYFNELVMSHVDAINLLYVAFTRAVDELYIYVPKRLNTKSSTASASIVEFISNAAADTCQESRIVGEDNMIESITYTYGSPIAHASDHRKSSATTGTLLGNYDSNIPQLKIRHRGTRYDEKGLSAGASIQSLGIKLHALFEKAHNMEELRSRITLMEQNCYIDTTEAAELRKKVEIALENPIVKEWFSDIWSEVKSEAEIIADGNVRRPDRVMIRGSRAVVVDYKFGENEERRYHTQMHNYVELLHKMGRYDSIEGYIWYITLGKIERVV